MGFVCSEVLVHQLICVMSKMFPWIPSRGFNGAGNFLTVVKFNEFI
jgi:hypothetical protein